MRADYQHVLHLCAQHTPEVEGGFSANGIGS